MDVSSRVHRMSPDLWGVFYEEIGYSGQGGIHQEQVFNSNFESFTADYAPWSAYTASSNASSSSVQYELLLSQDEPLNAYNPTALQVDTRVSGASSAVVGVTNPGYWGINLRGRSAFNFSLHARSTSVTSITVRLVSNDTTRTYAEAQLRVGRGWTKSSAILHVDAQVDDAALLLTWTSGNRSSVYATLRTHHTSTAHTRSALQLTPLSRSTAVLWCLCIGTWTWCLCCPPRTTPLCPFSDPTWAPSWRS